MSDTDKLLHEVALRLDATEADLITARDILRAVYEREVMTEFVADDCAQSLRHVGAAIEYVRAKRIQWQRAALDSEGAEDAE
jgi:hypothetical protein